MREGDAPLENLSPLANCVSLHPCVLEGSASQTLMCIQIAGNLIENADLVQGL